MFKLVLASVALLATYLYFKLREKRFKQRASLPQLPKSLVWGHLKTWNDFFQGGNKDRHPDAVFSDMNRALGNPAIMLVDLWPVNYPIVLVSNHEVAEQVSKATKLFPVSTPKSPTVNHITHLIGPHTILSKQGDDWKVVRKRFNPGFAPQYLAKLLPRILNKTTPFLARLDHFAQTGETFTLSKFTTDLTFDIIGDVTMDMDLDAQKEGPQRGELVQLYTELVRTYADDKADAPGWMVPRTELKRRRLGARIDKLLTETIRQKFTDMRSKSPETNPTITRSVLSTSFHDLNSLTPSVLTETRDQLKTFLFGGHDTTSSLLCWLLYELSRTPHALQAVRAELDSLFGVGASPSSVHAALLASGGSDLLSKMTYTAAVIKETLRLYPGAGGTARMAPPGSGFTVTVPTGERYSLEGVVIYNCGSIIQRDRGVYGDTADDFVPERWLGDRAGQVPASAWRPFERGPRNCIGQELAHIEGKVVVALVVGGFEFEKVGLGRVWRDERGLPALVEGKGQLRVVEELYSTREVTAKPADGMVMKVRLVGA